jgi:AraC-like DNA-binding protein
LQREKVIFGNAIIMLQPDMIRKIKNYSSQSIVDNIISQIYTFSNHSAAEMTSSSIPDASIDIVFYKKMNDDYQGMKIIGPSYEFNTSYVTFGGKTEYIGIRFKPCSPLRFENFNSKELFNAIIDIEVKDNQYDKLKQILSCGKSETEVIEYIKSFVLSSLFQNFGAKAEMVHDIINYILTNTGSFSLNDLSEYTGYTAYYLNKVFREHTGYSIGKYHRLIRTHRLLGAFEKSAMHNYAIQQSDICFELGFSDQAHMIREFKKYTGITPKKYWKKYYFDRNSL